MDAQEYAEHESDFFARYDYIAELQAEHRDPFDEQEYREFQAAYAANPEAFRPAPQPTIANTALDIPF